MPFGLLDHQGIGLDDLVYLFGDISELKLSVSGTEINEMPNQTEPVSEKVEKFRQFVAIGVFLAVISSMTMVSLADVDSWTIQLRETRDKTTRATAIPEYFRGRTTSLVP